MTINVEQLKELIQRHRTLAGTHDSKANVGAVVSNTFDWKHERAMADFYVSTADALVAFDQLRNDAREQALKSMSDLGQASDAYDAQLIAERERDMFKQAVMDLCEEFREHDRRHGSSAYTRAAALIGTAVLPTVTTVDDDAVNVTALKDHNQQLIAALKPFWDFSKHAVDANGWVGSGSERICDWFGPSDFWAVKKAMAVDIPKLLPCPFCGKEDLTVMENGNRELSVHCEDCDADATLEMWNRRSTVTKD